MTAQWPKVRLGECIDQRKTPVFIEDSKTYRRVTVQVHARGIVPRDEVEGRDIKTKRQYVTRGNDLLVAEIDALVAYVNAGTCNQLLNLLLRLAAEGAFEKVAGLANTRGHG